MPKGKDGEVSATSTADGSSKSNEETTDSDSETSHDALRWLDVDVEDISMNHAESQFFDVEAEFKINSPQLLDILADTDLPGISPLVASRSNEEQRETSI